MDVTTGEYQANTTDQPMMNTFCTSFTAFKAIYGTFITIFSISSICGNTLTLVVIKKYPVVRGPNNKYLLAVHLAVLQLMLGVVLLTYLFEINKSIINGFSGVRGALLLMLFICKRCSLFLSVLKRLFVTIYPFLYYAKKSYESRILSVFLFLVWIIAICIGFSSILLDNTIHNSNDSETIAHWGGLSLSPNSCIATAITFFILTALSVIFYIIVYLKLRKSSQDLNKSSSTIPQPTLVNIVMEIIFIVCWVPYISVLLKLGTSPVSCCICSFVLLFGYFDIAVSWFVNPLIDRKYKRAFLNLLCNIDMDN